MHDAWLDRWQTGRIGWHEADGNAGLKAHWPLAGDASRVLVPFCGKSPDLAWLANLGHVVTGIELAEIAARQFFEEQGLAFTMTEDQGFLRFTSTDLPVTILCGDYFDAEIDPCAALYDRGAIVAVLPEQRRRYVEKTRSLLAPDAAKLIVTLEYDQSVVAGPPFALMPDELSGYFDGLERVEEKDDLETCPPKFRAAGLTDIKEVFWRSAG